MIGTILNHYKIVAHLGHGGMGEVWIAEDTRLGRKVALKTLPSRVASDPDRRTRFEREARAVAALNHPNIVTIHSVEESGGVAFLTMELIEGKTLGDVIPPKGLPLGRFFDLAIPLASALAAAHQKGITHRDLKPANVMVTGDGRVKVLDFGLAKLAEWTSSEANDAMTTATATVTGEGKIVGTAAYMSPEQAEGKPVDARSDVFALGIVMYEMATGEPPFKGDTTISTITSILRDTPVAIGELKPEMPRHLGRIVQRCLAKEPDRRYQAALDVRNELEGLRGEVDSGQVDAKISGTAISLPPARASSRKVLPIAASVVVVLALVTAGIVLWPRLSGGSSHSPAIADDDKKSIAVLPFVNMSENAQNDYFSDGLSEELLNVLAKVPGLHVAARTSSFYFKGATANVSDIGRQLGVATILEGSVRRAGNRLRITAQLINAKDGFHLWSETYDRELIDIFAIQDNIAGEVVGALKIKLLGADAGASQAVRKPTTSLEAHDAYLLGQQKMARRTSASLTEAARSFQKAIDLDPNYALAYVGLADALQCLTDYSTLPQGEMLLKAEPLARKAIQLDGRLGEAYASLGSLAVYRGDVAAAVSAYQKAIELSPNYSMAYMWYGNILQGSDKKKALSMYEKALELDPLSPPVNMNLGYSLTQVGRADEAVARFRRAIEIEPGFMGGYRGLAFAYGDALNQPEEALRYERKAVEADPGNLSQHADLALRLSRMGRWDAAIAECRAISAKDPNFALAYRAMNEIYARQGRLDEAARWQRKAVDLDPAVLDALVGLFARQLDLGDESGARETQRRIVAKQPDGLLPHIVAYNFNIFLGELNEAGKEVRSLSDNAPSYVRNDAWMFDMRAGRFSEARDRYHSSNPELFDGTIPAIAIENLSAAINVAAAEMKLGEKQHAEMLLERCERYIASRDEGTRRASFRLEPMYIDAIRGRKEEALAAFRRAIDDGFRSQWWVAPLDPNFDLIRDDPRFVAMMKEVRADVDRMRKKGTLPFS